MGQWYLACEMIIGSALGLRDRGCFYGWVLSSYILFTLLCINESEFQVILRELMYGIYWIPKDFMVPTSFDC